MKISNKPLLFVIYVLIVLLCYFFIPLWYAYIVLFILFAVFTSNKDTPAFLLGFASVFVVWMALMSAIDAKNSSILSERISVLFKLPSKWLLFIVTELIGSILGGLASWFGKNLRLSFANAKQ